MQMARPACGRSFLPRADKRVSSPKHFRWAPICTTIWYWSSYRRGKLSCRGKLPTRIFVLLQPFPCREIMIIDLFLVALLSLVCLVLTDSSSLVTRPTEECHRSDGERSLEWQTPAVAYPFGSLHDLCVAVVVVLPDEVVRHFRQDLSILLIICHATAGVCHSRLHAPSDLWHSSVSLVTKEELSVSTRQTRDNKATKNRSMIIISLQGKGWRSTKNWKLKLFLLAISRGNSISPSCMNSNTGLWYK